MYRYTLTKPALKSLKKLPQAIQARIVLKLDWLVLTDNPLLFAKHLKDSQTGQYRFRVGDYRVIFDSKGKTLIVHAIGHRRHIYR